MRWSFCRFSEFAFFFSLSETGAQESKLTRSARSARTARSAQFLARCKLRDCEPSSRVVFDGGVFQSVLEYLRHDKINQNLRNHALQILSGVVKVEGGESEGGEKKSSSYLNCLKIVDQVGWQVPLVRLITPPDDTLLVSLLATIHSTLLAAETQDADASITHLRETLSIFRCEADRNNLRHSKHYGLILQISIFKSLPPPSPPLLHELIKVALEFIWIPHQCNGQQVSERRAKRAITEHITAQHSSAQHNQPTRFHGLLGTARYLHRHSIHRANSPIAIRSIEHNSV